MKICMTSPLTLLTTHVLVSESDRAARISVRVVAFPRPATTVVSISPRQDGRASVSFRRRTRAQAAANTAS